MGNTIAKLSFSSSEPKNGLLLNENTWHDRNVEDIMYDPRMNEMSLYSLIIW